MIHIPSRPDGGSEKSEQSAEGAWTVDADSLTLTPDDEEDDGVLQFRWALEGETLRARLAAGALPIAEALAVATQIASALAAAHSRHIVHRDVLRRRRARTGEALVGRQPGQSLLGAAHRAAGRSSLPLSRPGGG